MEDIKILDIVALLQPVPMTRLSLVEPEYESLSSLPKGQVGTVVETHYLDEKPYYLVEFSDHQGREYAIAHLTADELLVLHDELVSTGRIT